MRATVAVVGGGPKALFALQELHDRLPPDATASVDVYDPASPGGGAVWSPDLPVALRLNAPAEIVDARFSGLDDTLMDWIAREHPEHTSTRYPPRRLVGSYLRLAYARLTQTGRLAIHHRPERIVGIGTGHGLLDPSAYDEVLLCTGHAGPRLPATTDHVPAGGAADVRGAALTAIDTVLLLTEGRGGRWGRIPDDELGRLAYTPSGREPALIRLTSRTGAIMSPKPERPHPEARRAIDAAVPALRRWDPATGLDPLWRAVLDAASDIADRVGTRTNALRLWRALLTGRATADTTDWAGHDHAGFLRGRLEIDAGLRLPDEPWILGRVWHGLYRDMVRALDRVPRSARDQTRFRAAAIQQERTAFGPPADSTRKLLALMEAGILQLSTGRPAADPVEAVTTGPGVTRRPDSRDFHDPLYADLHRRGLVTIRQGERGVLTDRDAACLTSDGRRIEWLAVIGRPTEDPVLGHDTLDRTLHDDGRRWAAAVIERMAAR